MQILEDKMSSKLKWEILMRCFFIPTVGIWQSVILTIWIFPNTENKILQIMNIDYIEI